MNPPSTTVDSLLTEQDQLARKYRVILKPVPDQDDQVAVIPVNGNGVACNCGQAVTVKRSDVTSVEKTGELHHCGGNRYHIVDVSFSLRQASAP